jgi:acetylornithine deacetylase/succinyl-diaminopimelate desuccinylase-like protein
VNPHDGETAAGANEKPDGDATRVLTDRLVRASAAITALAARLVSIPSHVPGHDERGVAAAILAAGSALGLGSGSMGGAVPEHPNVLFQLAGARPGPDVLVVGHMDTKPPGEVGAWDRPPYPAIVQEGRLHGLGAADMKGALAAMLHAAATLRAGGLPARGRLTLAFTSDEEAEGRLGLPFLVEGGFVRPDMAFICEPSGLAEPFDTVNVGSRGFFGFRLVAVGRRLHSSLTEPGSMTAIGALSHVIDRLADVVDFGGPFAAPFEAGPTLNVATSLEAGVAPGIVPDVATARGDVRTVAGQTPADVVDALERGLARLREAEPRLDISLVPDGDVWPPTSLDPATPIVGALVSATERVTGRRPRLGSFPASTEAHALSSLGIPCVPAFGPGLLSAAHVPNESVSTDELTTAATIYALALASLLS